MGRRDNPDLESMAKTLDEIIVARINSQERLVLSKPPKFEKNSIVEYDKKLKLSAMSKFNNPGYTFAVNYHATNDDIKKFKPLGAVIIYFVEADIPIFLKAFELRNFDDENPEEIAAQCLAFSKPLATQFAENLTSKGYIKLIMGEPVCARNDVNGIGFSFDQYDKYEISYFIKDIKIMVAELTMTIVPKGR